MKLYILENNETDIDDLDSLFLDDSKVSEGMTFASMLITHKEEKAISQKIASARIAALKIKRYTQEIEAIKTKMIGYKTTTKKVFYKDHEGFYIESNVFAINIAKGNRNIKSLKSLIKELL